MPITTTNGGVKAVSKVMLYPHKYRMPRVHTTPKTTTSKERSVVLTERKNISSISALSINEPIKKNFISF